MEYIGRIPPEVIIKSLNDIIQSQNITISDLSQKTNLPERTIKSFLKKYNRKKNDFNFDVALCISHALGFSIDFVNENRKPKGDEELYADKILYINMMRLIDEMDEVNEILMLLSFIFFGLTIIVICGLILRISIG